MNTEAIEKCIAFAKREAYTDEREIAEQASIELEAIDRTLYDQKAIIEHFHKLLNVDTSTSAFVKLTQLRADLAAAVSTLRAVRADRPSAHSDKVWQMVNETIARLEGGDK